MARVEKKTDLTGVVDSFINSERRTVALMSDGVILEKRDVVFRNDKPIGEWDSPNRDKHCYGWTVMMKVKTLPTVEKFVEVFAKRGYAPVK